MCSQSHHTDRCCDSGQWWLLRYGEYHQHGRPAHLVQWYHRSVLPVVLRWVKSTEVWWGSCRGRWCGPVLMFGSRGRRWKTATLWPAGETEFQMITQTVDVEAFKPLTCQYPWNKLALQPHLKIRIRKGQSVYSGSKHQDWNHLRETNYTNVDNKSTERLSWF